MRLYTYRLICLNYDTSIKIIDYENFYKIKTYAQFKGLEDELNKIGKIDGCIIDYMEFKQKNKGEI